MHNNQNISVRDICRVALDEARSHREVGRMLGISPTTVSKHRNLMRIYGIDRPRLDQLSEVAIEELVQARAKERSSQAVEPDWEHLCKELSRPNVTRALLFQEYILQHQGQITLSETSFGRRLRAQMKKQKLSMRQNHLPGDCMFVDFSGKTLKLHDPITKQKQPVQVFVSGLSVSQLIFATAVETQRLADWIEANTRALEYYGGVPEKIVPDNLKAAATKPRTRGTGPEINRTYLDFAEHYGVDICPARPLRPQDKSIAEINVRLVNIWIIAALRDRVFYSLTEMNAAIRELVDQANLKRSRRLGASRREIFEAKEAVALKPLPRDRYEVVVWRDKVKVPKDYHLQHEGNYYSVPPSLVGQEVNMAISRSTLRVFSRDKVGPVAVHPISKGQGENVTKREHMPESHRSYAYPDRKELFAWAAEISPSVVDLFEAIVSNKRIRLQAANSQMARAMKLARQYGPERLASACRYANSVRTQTMESVSNILRHGIDQRVEDSRNPIVSKPIAHKNVRGPKSYRGDGDAE